MIKPMCKGTGTSGTEWIPPLLMIPSSRRWDGKAKSKMWCREWREPMSLHNRGALRSSRSERITLLFGVNYSLLSNWAWLVIKAFSLMCWAGEANEYIRALFYHNKNCTFQCKEQRHVKQLFQLYICCCCLRRMISLIWPEITASKLLWGTCVFMCS